MRKQIPTTHRTKGTGGMEGCVVLFKPRNHLFACTHPSVSNTLDCNGWLVHKHQSTALCFKHVWIVDPCLRTRMSLQPCVSNTFGLWFRVCVQASVYSPLIKHIWIVVPCCVQASPPGVSNTFGLWFLVCVHVSDSSPVFKHVWIMVLCLCTHISQQPFVSNTFDCSCLHVYPPAHTKMKVTPELE